jgi:hypothetical protein
MNFIERLLHWAPDGGSGSLETLFVVSALFVGTAVFLRRIAAWSRLSREPQR